MYDPKGNRFPGHCVGLALLDSNRKNVIQDDDSEYRLKSCITIVNGEKLIGLHGIYHIPTKCFVRLSIITRRN